MIGYVQHFVQIAGLQIVRDTLRNVAQEIRVATASLESIIVPQCCNHVLSVRMNLVQSCSGLATLSQSSLAIPQEKLADSGQDGAVLRNQGTVDHCGWGHREQRTTAATLQNGNL